MAKLMANHTVFARPAESRLRTDNSGFEYRTALLDAEERIYLKVPFEDNQPAQVAGLTWDGLRRAYFAMPYTPVAAHYRWIKTVEGTATGMERLQLK